MADIKYIQLEPAAFLTDIDFQMMNAEQRGVYCSIIFYLYCNGGQIELDNGEITLLHNKFSVLGTISACHKIGKEWDAIWLKIADKFQISGNILTHKRVTEELKKAKNRVEQKREAGRKGMASRYGDNTVITKESKVKKSKDNNIHIDPNEFLTYWNSKSTLPKIQVFNDTRKKMLKTRCKEKIFTDNWKRIIDNLASSRFHIGNSAGGWKATVNWILKNDTNYCKILELKSAQTSTVERNKAGLTPRQQVLQDIEKKRGTK